MMAHGMYLAEAQTSSRALKEKEDIDKVTRQQQLAVIESNLLTLNLEKDKCKDELSKLPMAPKKADQIRRREYLESEIQTLTRQIGTIKHKLRDLNAY